MKKLRLLIFIVMMMVCNRFNAAILEDNSSSDDKACSALYQAIDSKDIHLIERLLSQSPDVINDSFHDRWNPLVYVLHYYGHDYDFVHKVAELLLENGALIDVWRYEAGYKLAPIHYIAAYGYADMLHMFLKHNPSMDKLIDDGRGGTALHYAAGKRLPNLGSYKVRGRSWSPSADRRAQLMTDEAVEAVEKKVGYDHTCRLYLTPEEEHINRLWVVRNLLESGVPIDKSDATGKTPVEYGREHFTLVARLLEQWSVRPIEQIVTIEDILKELKSDRT